MAHLQTKQGAPLQGIAGNFAPRLRVVAKISAILTAAIGAIILGGWWLGLDALKCSFSGGLPIKPNIGAFLSVCGASLAFLSSRTPTKRSRVCAAFLARVVIFFGALTLTESIVGIDLRIDRLVVPGCAAPSEDWKWRMMPGTAFSFEVIAIALFMATQRPTRLRLWLISGLSASQLIPAIISLGGLGVERFLGSQWNLMGMTPSSAPVAMAFVLLSGGLLAFLRNAGHFRWSLDALTTVGFATGVLIMLTTPACAFSFAKQMLETNRAISHRQEVLKEIEEVAADVSNLASGERGYAITADSALLKNRERETTTLRDDLEDVARLTFDEKGQQRRLEELRPLLSRHIEWENNVINSRHGDGFAAAVKLVATNQGNSQLNQIGELLGKMRQEEYDLLASDEKQAQNASDATFVLLPLGVFLTLAILSLSFFFLNSGMGERAQAEKALRKAEEKYRSIFENAVAGIFQSRPDGTLIGANPALARMCGYSSPQEMKDNVNDVSRIYVDRQRRAEWKQAIEAKGHVNEFEYEIYRRDGSRSWVSANTRAVRNSDGTIAYYEGMLQDITQRKRVEEVERINQAKSEFLSRISHELRTPLNAILGFGQLLERQGPTDTQRSHIGYIIQAGRHLLGLINEVLDISRIESGRLQLSVEPVRVEEILGEALDLMRPLAAEHATTISTQASGEPHYVLADRQRLKQTLINLLANAIKYSPNGSVVTCSLGQSIDNRLRILISDTGPGIPEEKMSHLFRPFDRLGAEQTGIEGTGLGLALSKRLIEAMNGSIGVQSRVGDGSTFWVELPRAKSPLRAEGLGVKIATMASEFDPAADQQRVLYVEDNLSNVTLVEQLLEERPNIELLVAKSGEVGLDLARRHLPDLILLDLHLPGLSGRDVLRQLKRDAATSLIPVIVISADATKRQIERLLTDGARDYLTKPIDVTEFLRAIDRVLAAKEEQCAAA